jgi:NTP pyrophosphatase (non-canonical NTP hydrolase)
MMEIIKKQLAFDREHGLDEFNSRDKLEENLKYHLIAIQGEVGEIANLLKKELRRIRMEGGEISPGFFDKAREEVADIFMYLIKLSEVLGMDLEKETERKLERNREKFAKYRRS